MEEILINTAAKFSRFWTHIIIWALSILALWMMFPKRVGTVSMIDGENRIAVHLPCRQQRDVASFEVRLLSPIKTLSVRAVDKMDRFDIDGHFTPISFRNQGSERHYAGLIIPETAGSAEHLLNFTVHSVRGEVWFDIKEAHGFTWLKVFCLILWGVGSFALATRCGYRPWVGWPLAVAGLLVAQNLDFTTPWVRQHDVEGHREYIDYLSSTGKVPAVQHGCETWQPPLYYLVATGWRGLCARLGFSYDDPFRSVQFLAATLYLITILLALLAFGKLHLNDLEALGALSILVLLPEHLFSASRINNDTLLPVIGLGVMFVLCKFVKSKERRWLWWLAVLLPALSATKGSSLAIVGVALLIVCWVEMGSSDLRSGLFRAYLTGLPAVIWLFFWWGRNIVQTGDPLYVNAALPDELRICQPAWQRLLSFDLNSFFSGRNYFDGPVRVSYPTALATSMLQGEYNFDDYRFHWRWLLRSGFLGMLVLLAVGVVVRPRPELRATWATCLCLALAQVTIMVAYAIQFPFACNQNMRFFAQAFVPISCLWGMGINHFWSRTHWAGLVVLVAILFAFVIGLGEFYGRLLF